MSDGEILEKAISKAIDNGWNYMAFEYKDESGFTKKSHESYNEERQMFITDWQSEIPAYALVFNHDFAKALWGEAEEQGFKLKNGKFEKYGKEGWRRHVTQMVLSDNPIKYLGENI